MSRNTHLDTVKILKDRTYPLPQVHYPIGQRHESIECGEHRRPKLGLGINAKTGRLQWCPGFTCCKLLILLPVVMLPITLVLVFLIRMDSLVTALHLQEQRERDPYEQQRQFLQKSPFYVEDYEVPLSGGSEEVNDHHGSDNFDILRDEEFLLPQRNNQIDRSVTDRSRRCMPYRYPTSENFDMEDHDLMKDARTSFLPYPNAIPRECLHPASMPHTRLQGRYDHKSSIWDLDAILNQYKRSERTRRTSNDRPVVRFDRLDAHVDVNEGDTKNEFETHEDEIEAHIRETTAALQSFWNEQGTMKSIRIAQAKTMKQYMDLKVDPCVDFYKYACGNWEKKHPIPRDKAGFDTFEMLRESLDLVLKQLLERDSSPTHKLSKAMNQRQAHVKNNQYATDPKSPTDIADAGADGPKDIIDALKELDIASLSEQRLNLRAEMLRHRMIRKRRMLDEILERYKRKATNTKRKRLVEPPRDIPKVIQAPAKGLNVVGYTKIADAPPNEFLKPQYDAQAKAKNLYKSCINNGILAKRGLEPLHQLISDLGGWPVLDPNWDESMFDWQHLAAKLRRFNNDILIVQWVGPDIKNSEENIVQFDQTSLGLPTREYFLQETNSKYLLAYQRFMSDIMHKLGAQKSEALRTAAELITFETQLASITAPAEQRLNVTKLYKRMTLNQLHMTVPQINWMHYLSTLQRREVKDDEEVVIYATDYMKQLVSLIDETDPRVVSNYMMWRFIRHRINNVDDRFDDIKQTFYHALFGREESPQRWKVCIAQVNTNMGMAVGSMFVSRYFDDNSKRDTLRMTHELQQAFRDILKTTDWLDDRTKTLAEEKVNAMSLKIGYPDFILNTEQLNEKYAGIEIHPDLYFENTLNVLLHTAQTEQNKLHERVNKTNWQTAPAIVNAYYSRNKNQIMFPAGILQPPFYHRYFPKALNFGGIGVVIGHELTHGFDDKGRLFDSNGNIHKWWSDSSIRGFDERARCIIAQYSNYTVEEVGIALNGESTQGENIADNGGLRQAFYAYGRWLNANPTLAEEEYLPGLNMTGPQLFFLNFGQVWCGAMRPEAVRNKLNTAIHSPGRFRVIGTLSNSYDFAREFQCPPGSPMNPYQKCSVW